MKKNRENKSNNENNNNIEKILINIGSKLINTDMSPQVIDNTCNKTYKKSSLKPAFTMVCFLIVLILAGCALKHFLFTNSAYDNAVNNADKNGLTKPLNVSCTKNNIKIKLLGVINDGERVLLQAQIFQKGKELKLTNISVSGIKLVTASGEEYSFSRFGGGDTQQSSEAGIIEFTAKIPKSQIMTLKIKSMNNIVGNWELKFPITGEGSRTYTCDFSQTIDSMNFYISSLTISKTQIKVKVVMTGEFAYYRTDGTIYTGKEKGREISAEGYNTGINDQVSEVITYEYISLAGEKNMLMDFSFANPNDENGKPIKYRIKVPLNIK